MGLRLSVIAQPRRAGSPQIIGSSDHERLTAMD
jgi:hypothetical protein